ncbi:putative lipid II flippase MurJ [Clostridia bacterium]|nr:putative lipid II flippase MurJ [Clostridia bacterium]
MIFATALSKVLGLVRVMLMAAYYGDSMEAKAFLTALRIPLSFFDLLLGAAILGVFIPVFNSFANDGDSLQRNRDQEKFAGLFFTVVTLVTGLLSLLGIIFAPDIIAFVTPGYDPATAALAANLLRILFPMVVFTGATYTLIGVLQSKDEYLVPALVSSISNLGVIVYFLVLDSTFGILGLAVAYLISWLIQLLTLVIPLWKKRFRLQISLKLRDKNLIKCVKMMLPIMAGSWFLPASLLLLQNAASKVDDILVVEFEYAMQLFLLITGIIVFGVCNYIFPKLSQTANSDGDDFNKTVRTGISSILFVIIPVSLGVLILYREAVAVVYMRGAFDAFVTDETAGAFIVFALGMVPYALIELLNRVFYAKQMVKFPMIASLTGIFVLFVLNSVEIEESTRWFEITKFYTSVSFPVCVILIALILIISLAVKLRGIITRKLLLNIVKIILSAAVMTAVMAIIAIPIGNDASQSGLFQNIFTALAVFVPGVIVFLVMSVLLKTDEGKIIIGILTGKQKGKGAK